MFQFLNIYEEDVRNAYVVSNEIKKVSLYIECLQELACGTFWE